MRLSAAVWAWLGIRRGKSPVRTRVTLPAVVDVPRETVRILRQQDHRLDLYPLPDGRVWLLLKSDVPARIASGRTDLWAGKVEAFDEPMYSASLMAQGFELIGEFSWAEGMSAGYLLRVAQEALYMTERARREVHAARRARSDGTAHLVRAKHVMTERVRLGARSDFAWAYRGRRSFSNVG